MHYNVETDLIDPTALDPYGAVNRAEFFAVATEAFFERPWALRQEQPRLFASIGDPELPKA